MGDELGWWACDGPVEGRSGPLEARLVCTSGAWPRRGKSACFVMEFDALRARVEVEKGAMMIPQHSSTQGCA